MKTTKEKIAVMQAFEDGKETEKLVNVNWRDVVIDEPDWDWKNYDYRTKEPET